MIDLRDILARCEEISNNALADKVDFHSLDEGVIDHLVENCILHYARWYEGGNITEHHRRSMHEILRCLLGIQNDVAGIWIDRQRTTLENEQQYYDDLASLRLHAQHLKSTVHAFRSEIGDIIEPRAIFKQCLILRTDLNLSPGKMCAQAAHASLCAYEKAPSPDKQLWFTEEMTKITLKAPNEQAIRELKELAEKHGLPTALIMDAGHTEVSPGTITALGIGPAKSELINKVTGNLPLL